MNKKVLVIVTVFIKKYEKTVLLQIPTIYFKQYKCLFHSKLTVYYKTKKKYTYIKQFIVKGI